MLVITDSCSPLDLYRSLFQLIFIAIGLFLVSFVERTLPCQRPLRVRVRLCTVLTYFGHLIRDWYRSLARLGRHCFAFSCGTRPIFGVMLLHPHPVYSNLVSNLVSRPGCRLPSALLYTERS